MMRIMSEEEVRVHDASIKALYDSGSIEDWILAVLRDSKIGAEAEQYAPGTQRDAVKANLIAMWIRNLKGSLTPEQTAKLDWNNPFVKRI